MRRKNLKTIAMFYFDGYSCQALPCQLAPKMTFRELPCSSKGLDSPPPPPSNNSFNFAFSFLSVSFLPSFLSLLPSLPPSGPLPPLSEAINALFGSLMVRQECWCCYQSPSYLWNVKVRRDLRSITAIHQVVKSTDTGNKQLK